jgi:hypothetical protein
VYEEKNKYEEIDVKQAIYYIREAWREVSKQTIKNCWKKTRITNDEENEDVVLVLEEEEKKAEELAIDFSKLSKGEISQWFKQFAYTPKEYIDADADAEVANQLSDREIFEMVTQTEEEENEVQVQLDREPQRVISFKEAIEGFETVFEFFKQQSAASEKFENDLDRLTEFRIRLDELKEERKKQAKITDLFDFNQL